MKFEVLIPIWGQRYVTRFAQFGLRSLLAPRNLPYLSRLHDVKVAILTTTESRQFVEQNLVFRRLAEVTQISFIEIDDLLATYQTNYSAILTRAFNRAMALNKNMLGTAFIYLVGDLIFSDGALDTVAATMQDGHDACIMCSPRVDATALDPILDRRGSLSELVLSHREMAGFLMKYPHPTLLAKIVRGETVNLSIANQFFWCPERDTMVSRCLLLHMLCIRPTQRPLDIAAPCDFSFVTELVPGGRYQYLTNSDQFIALEVQNTGHEARYISTWPQTIYDVAEGASSWATSQHHGFIEATYVFRAGSSDYSEEKARKLTQSYVDKLLAGMSPPVDHRHHLFWLGSVGARLLEKPQYELGSHGEGEQAPVVLRQLILAHQNLALGVSVNDRLGPVDAILAALAATAVRIPIGKFYEIAEDVVTPGGSVLVVMCGGLGDYYNLFGQQSQMSRVLSLAGPERTILLCYQFDLDVFRGKPSARRELFDLYTANITLFSKFRLRARIHDLSGSPFDRIHGFVIEIDQDEAAMPQVIWTGSEENDLLLGRRE